MTKIKNSVPDYLSAAERPFKRIYGILRDRQFVWFKLSIKLWRKSGKPKGFAIEGQRSTGGGWDTRFPQDQSSRELESAETLKERFVKIEQSVRDYIAGNGLVEQWDKLEAPIKKALQSGRSIDEILSDTELSVLGFFEYGYEAHFAAPIIARVCAIAGSRALLDGDLSYASYCADRGLYWSGADVLIANPRERFKPRAGEGGKGKARRNDPVKDKVAKLLETLAPVDGWDSLHNAIDRVSVDLIAKHSQFVEDCGLKCHALPQTIRGWIKKDPSRFPHRIRTGP